jgi:outer membrane lipoprotein LolB
MRQRHPLSRTGWVLLLAGALAACAHTPPPPAAGVRTGRLALTIDTSPPQHWSAAFELSGNPQQGELRLLSPLGQTVATVHWSALGAWLDRGDGGPQAYASLEALSAELTGAAVPLASLFAWLDGDAVPIPGWTIEADPAQPGRLRARRSAPAPAVDLRLVWQP